MSTFAALLTAHRVRVGLTQYRLARTTGINIGTVNRMEHGHRLPASREQVALLAAALNLTRYQIDELYHHAGMVCSACPMRQYASCEEARMEG